MFHERFELQVEAQEARRRFVARISNLIFERFAVDNFESYERVKLEQYVASVLGERHSGHYLVTLATVGDFLQHLQAVEAIYSYLGRDPYTAPKQLKLIERVREVLAMVETDIGVRWEGGRFIPEGARLLDDKLVNDPLRWLRERGHENVLSPYQKGLQHFLQSHNNPALLSDVVTDMYEALEALAKSMTGRDDDLSANQELFIKNVKASDGYKRLLKVYIEYANDFRHAAEPGTVRPTPSAGEVENFIYLTGTFIRLAMS